MPGRMMEEPWKTSLQLEILAQPDDQTCGPTCLHAVYRYFGLDASIAEVIAETPRLANGGTLAVMLGLCALRRGFEATVYTYSLDLFDPTWFKTHADLVAKLREQARFKRGSRFLAATEAYCDFLGAGGKVRFETLNRRLVRRYLNQSVPILAGLSATYLYETPREHAATDEYDDVHGEPAGHFVVLCGYDRLTKKVAVADPFEPNPVSGERYYEVDIDRVLCSILLGVYTYDATLLVLRPKGRHRKNHENTHCC